MKPIFITADEVAQLLGLDSGGAFLRARTRLEDETYFPAPMPVPLKPLKWRRDAVEAWRDAQGRPASNGISADAIRAAGPNVVLMAEAGRV